MESALFSSELSCDWRLGDVFELIKTIPDNSIDFLLTDPPYNIGSYSTGNIKFTSRKDFNNDIAAWDQDEIDPVILSDEFRRVLSPKGNLFIFTGSNLFGKWHERLDPVFDTFQYFCWHKTNPTPSARKSSFLNSMELMVCCWNKGHYWNFKTQKEMHNFFESGICQGKERLAHPTQKPLKLLRHLIEIACPPGGTVFDPFGGVASSGVAAREVGCNFIGFEIDQTYHDLGKSRLFSC